MFFFCFSDLPQVFGFLLTGFVQVHWHFHLSCHETHITLTDEAECPIRFQFADTSPTTSVFSVCPKGSLDFPVYYYWTPDRQFAFRPKSNCRTLKASLGLMDYWITSYVTSAPISFFGLFIFLFFFLRSKSHAVFTYSVFSLFALSSPLSLICVL